MKRILFKLTLVLSFIGVVFGAEIKDAILQRIMTTKVEEFLSADYLTGVVNAEAKHLNSWNYGFNDIYHEYRGATYEVLFKDDQVGAEYYRRESYLQTVTLAYFKRELHKGNTLMTVYKGSREKLKATISGQPVEFRKKLLVVITNATQAFKVSGNAEYRKGMNIFLAEQSRRFFDTDHYVLQRMLANNESPEAIIKRHAELQTPAKAPASFTAPTDIAATQFAERRYKEGGKALVDKYLAVLALMKVDVESTMPAENKK